MSDPHPAGFNTDERPARSIAGRIADATTRLILIAIVAGGLLTVVLNISRLQSLADSDAPSTEPVDVAPAEDLLANGLPVTRTVVHGDEAAARAAIVRFGREKLTGEAERLAATQDHNAATVDHAERFEDAVELAADARGRWKILETQDVKRLIIGVLQTAPEATIIFWGGYDETGPGEWSTWTMQLPLSEKSE